MSMLEAVICISNVGSIERGTLGSNTPYSIDKVIVKMSSGRRLTRYAVCVNHTWESNQQMTLKEAREAVARLRDDFEIRPFKPIPIAEMRKVAKEQGYEQAYNILLIGGYGFIEGTVKDYDELLEEFRKGMEDNAV